MRFFKGIWRPLNGLSKACWRTFERFWGSSKCFQKPLKGLQNTFETTAPQLQSPLGLHWRRRKEEEEEEEEEVEEEEGAIVNLPNIC